MARLRTLKPEFFTHELLAELSPLHRLLYQGLWCHADREGRLEDRPRYLKTVILPYDACDVDRMLSDLEGKGFIRRYEADGKRCIAIPTFLHHQNPHPKDKPSLIPPPPVGAATNGPRMETPPQGTAITHAAEFRGKPRENQDEPRHYTDEPGSIDSRSSIGPRSGHAVEDEEHEDGADAPPADAGQHHPADLQALWNKNAPPELPRWEKMPDGRKDKAKKALKRRTLLSWLSVIQRMHSSGFLRGAKGWRPGPDWILKPGIAERILEGTYDDDGGTGPPPNPEDLCSICHESSDCFRSASAGDVLICYGCNANSREAVS